MKLLPDGREEIVEKIIQLGPTKFKQISQHILERIPNIVDIANTLDAEEREKLLGSLQTDPISELAVFLTISELWKNIAYYQPKLQPLLESLTEAGFDAEMRNTAVKIWSESGLTVSNRLRDISFSGRPNVIDIGWTLRKTVASSDNPVMRATEVIVQFDTDRGSKIIELSRSKLTELYMIVQEVQKSLDILLEGE
ncbi:putative isochorismate synthase MenF [Dirofilaria immitis]